MLASYEDFILNLTNAIKYRSKNFVNTDCDIGVLIETVYQDVQSVVIFDYKMYNILVENIINNTVVLPDSDTGDHEATELYGPVMDITDNESCNVSKYFNEIDRKVYHVNDSFLQNTNSISIDFIMPVTRPLEYLDAHIVNKLNKVLLEGVMWHIHQSIPFAPDAQPIVQAQFARYEYAKKELINMLPQVMYKKKGVRYE